jgi:outer membrane protein assembly factor BamB
MIQPMKQLPVLVGVFVLFPALARGEEWPGWRGPRGDGSSREKKLPVHWNEKENICWKTPLPGIGHSSPAIFGERVFLTTCRLEEQERVLLCLDRKSGKILWERVVVTAPLERKHNLNSFASSTPATDGKHVWITFLQFPDMIAACYDVDGNLVWKKSPGKFHSVHGFCSSPVLYKDMVIINGDQDAVAYIVALDRNTGEERWRADRPKRTRSYCVPIIVDAAGKKQLVLSGSRCVTSYDPDTGKLHWIIDGPTEQYVASLVYGQGLLFLTTGFPEYHNMAIRPDGTGDITHTHIAWHEARVPARKASYVPSPIAFDKWFYVISDQGWLSCFEATTGKRLWLKQLGRHHSGSPVLADGRIYMTDDDGVTYVLKAGPDFEVIARNPLGDECYSSPAISRGQIFIRTNHHLYCIDK